MWSNVSSYLYEILRRFLNLSAGGKPKVAPVGANAPSTLQSGLSQQQGHKVSPMKVTDLVGFGKLVDIISKGCGTLYRPIAIRREGKATLEVDEERARRLPVADAEGRALAAQWEDDLKARSQKRIEARAIEGQRNLEAVAEHAVTALPATISDTPVNEDWRRRFFQIAENICDDDMRQLWGKILAGEVASPGAFSLRTLEVVRNLTKEEAEAFQRACSFAFSDGIIVAMGRDIDREFGKFGFRNDDVVQLRDAGLMTPKVHFSPFEPLDNTQPSTRPQQFEMENNGLLVRFSRPHGGLASSVLEFTNAGKELQHLIDPNPNHDYLAGLFAYWNMGGCNVKRGVLRQQPDGGSVMVFEDWPLPPSVTPPKTST